MSWVPRLALNGTGASPSPEFGTSDRSATVVSLARNIDST